MYDVVGIFRAALNKVISDDSSNTSIVLGYTLAKTRNEPSCLRVTVMWLFLQI